MVEFLLIIIDLFFKNKKKTNIGFAVSWERMFLSTYSPNASLFCHFLDHKTRQCSSLQLQFNNHFIWRQIIWQKKTRKRISIIWQKENKKKKKKQTILCVCLSGFIWSRQHLSKSTSCLCIFTSILNRLVQFIKFPAFLCHSLSPHFLIPILIFNLQIFENLASLHFRNPVNSIVFARSQSLALY